VMTDPSNLMPAFTKLGSYGGAQYGMPFTTSSRTLFYNKKLFAQAGIAAPPQTWDELYTDAGKIEALGKIGYGMPLGPEEAQAETLLWLLGNGGGYQDASGKWVINSPQNVETLEFMTKLVKAGYTEPNPGTKNRAVILEQFAQGQIGMINGITALLPIIAQAGVLKDSDWGTAAITGKSGPLDSTLGVCDFMAAFKTDGSKQAAIKKFIDFALQDQYQIAFAKEYNLLPGTTSGAAAFSKIDPQLAPFMAALPHAVQYPNDPVWAQVKVQIQQIIGTAIGPDPKPVLDTIQETALKGS
jgi:multiple sugar transport system substrate-binding protein